MALRALLRAGGPSWRATAAATSVSHGGRRGSKNLDWFYNAIAEEAKEKVEHPVYPAEPLHGRKRARVFMDFQFGREATPEAPPSRVVFELADDIVPLTADNFVNLCERPAGSGYRGSEIFTVRKGFGLIGGDWTHNNGRGGHSSFPERTFIDENFVARHAAPGVLTMASSGVHSNSSVFMVTLAKLPHLDGRHVAFGRVLTGMDTIARIGATFCVNFKPATPVVIANAGRLPEAEWAAVDKVVAAAEAAAAAAKAKASAAAAAAPAGAASAAAAAASAAGGKKAKA